jgi:hypothetical protein
MIAVAAFAAWLGAAMIVLSDGRRGLALGLGLTTAAFAMLVWVGGQPLAAVALLLGGAVAVVRGLQVGRQGWAMMPPRSTPRLVLAIAGGLLALWISTSVMTGSGAPLRFAALSVLAMMGARILAEMEPAALLTALAALAMAVAVGAGIADTAPGPSVYIVAAATVLALSLVSVQVADGT